MSVLPPTSHTFLFFFKYLAKPAKKIKKSKEQIDVVGIETKGKEGVEEAANPRPVRAMPQSDH